MTRGLSVDGVEDAVLLISGVRDSKGGGLLAYDGRVVERIDFVGSRGLTVADGTLVRVLDQPDQPSVPGELIVYDESGVRNYLRVDDLTDSHDITWDGTSYVAVSCFGNAILWIDRAGDVVRTWRAPGDPDSWHLNGVHIVDGRMVICAFGRYSRFREWSAALTRGEGVVFDIDTGQDVLVGLSGPHHPRVIDDRWTVCNSGTSELWRFDAAGGLPEQRVPLRGWTRGLAVSDDLIFVGESAFRHSPTPSSTASVAIVSRSDFALVDRIMLPCAEIYDLLFVPASLAEGARRAFGTIPGRIRRDTLATFNSFGAQPTQLLATGAPLPPEAMDIRIEASLPDELIGGRLIEVEATIENLATSVLASASPYPLHLGDRWYARQPPANDFIEGFRFRLPCALHPKEPVRFSTMLRAPARAGVYELVLTLVQEDVTWFDAVSSDNAFRAIVTVVHDAAHAATDPTSSSPPAS